jgi:hypothetical protein
MLITKRVTIYLKNIKEMPFLLRISCYGTMFAAPIFPLFLLLPNTEVEFMGHQIAGPELWTYGLDAAMATSMAFIIFGFWGLVARKSTSRWLLVFSPLAPYIFWAALPSQLTAYDAVVSAALTAVALYVYLFHVKAVREYLDSNGVGK